MNELTLKKYCEILNQETLTQKEKAQELGKGVRMVKLDTARGKYKTIRPKGRLLYFREKNK